MSKDRPELIFVEGPQKGQRLVLTRPRAVLGRGSGSDILLSEEYVSRQHARYELLQIGPTLENLSARGTWINGKRFKTGKKVQLETGDLIGLGAQTQVLFVAAGDDPDEALSEYRRSRKGGKDAFGRRVKAEAPEPAAAVEPALEAEQQSQEELEILVEEEKPGRPSEMTPGEREQAAESARRRKLMLGLGVYVGCIVLAGIVISMFVNVGGGEGLGEQPILTDAQIKGHLRTPLKRTPNPVQREKNLQEARGLYAQYELNWRHLHQIEDQRIYNECLARYTQLVQQKYREACILEKNKDWAIAEARFRDLLSLIGEQRDPVFTNVQAHYGRAKYYHEKSQPKKNPLWR
jgi:pSer/pThr/pTyr-binding forkhead associated (FHA) protein